MAKGAGQSALERYTPVSKISNRLAADPIGMPVHAVVEKVHEALRTRTPKTRYVLGEDAKMLRFVGRFPDTLCDRLTLKILKQMAGT